MSILKYVERVKRIDSLISKKATGSPEAFAEKMNLCRSSLLECIREMRELGAPISYCKNRATYYYDKDTELFIEFRQSKRFETDSN
jgi:biotin operon repressor